MMKKNPYQRFVEPAFGLLPGPLERVAILFVVGLLVGVGVSRVGSFVSVRLPPEHMQSDSQFIYSFNSTGILNETGSMEESPSPYWWVDSGGQLIVGGGTGSTMMGYAPAGSYWRALYQNDNPEDTDEGAHPQNIFRLVTKSTWENFAAQADFFIAKDNFSSSTNRNASNGLLLMSRYADAGQTLYYAGIRVDGTAVIKKKYKGTYYTMAQQQVFPGAYQGDQDSQNLLPHGEWISLRSEVSTLADGSVEVKLFTKLPTDPGWSEVLDAADSGQYDGTPPISAAGFAGIRTDFMDVEFQNYKLEKL